ncbi:hypothetical protein BSK59_15765 [Paenibacillus odorifer]|uniref:hypothetical protein n=1 Tax=Paenibacillus odorifer TaxID=189426 RepID=UPI00096FB77F|nr:hypothetical protein [Paenibacillus odorifer]OME54037.1 hypothetical protein BSK59_15765 [Paenibacillus odorifer]
MAKGNNLEQTKGKIKLVGRVKGIGNPNSVREGFTKSSEKQFKSLQFFLETSAINNVRVELFGMEKDQVTAYSMKDRKSKKIDWAKRKNDFGDYKVMGTGCYLESDPTDSSKKLRKILPEFDAVDYIKANLKDGDIVRINGEIDFQEFENKQGKLVSSSKFSIKSITKLDDELDFNSSEFKEESKFEHEIIIGDVMMDDETKRLHVSAKVIKYGGDIVDTSFTVDTEKYPKLAGNMTKRFGFGDFIKVYGLIINSVILKEAEDELNDSAEEEDWGGDDEIKKDFDNNFLKEYTQELQITSVDSSTYEPKKYKEEDLMSEDEDAFNGDVKGNGGNPPADDFNDEDEEGMDDLPFE